jgi:hypothetical protein
MPDPPMLLIRPGTLAEVQRLVRVDGEKLRFCLAGFLDQFYKDRDLASRYARITDDPGLTGDARFDALMGAIGEHLSRRWQIGPPPPWTDDPARFLSRPWFMGTERMKGFLLVESPMAYRRRFIFTEAEPLRRHPHAARRALVGLRDDAHRPHAAPGGNRGLAAVGGCEGIARSPA